MPAVTRSAEKGWTAKDLLSFNIQVVPEDTQTFFGVADLPKPDVPSTVWDNAQRPQVNPSTLFESGFFFRLEEVMDRPDEVAPVHEFVTFLLRTLKFNIKWRMIHGGTDLQFTMCGTEVSTKPNVVIIDHAEIGDLERYVLLVQEVENKVIVMQSACFSELTIVL